MRVADFVNNLIAHGRCCFTLDEAESALNKSRHSIVLSIERLKAKGALASPARGFYVIITPEYQIYGCLPAELFMPFLMAYWQIPYYAGLLTAAMYHGASHQQPQVFHVIVPKNKPDICCGKIRIKFIAKKNANNVPTQTISTEKSLLTISTPEVTAMDLLLYSLQSGGLNHIITVLDELQESIHSDTLKQLLTEQPGVHWKQRLGYLLELLGAEKLSHVVFKQLQAEKRVDYILLMPGLKQPQNAHRKKKWKIIVNTQLESDL